MTNDPTGFMSEETTELVARAIELRDEGHADWLERACSDDLSQCARVLEAVEATSALHEFFVDGLAKDARTQTTLDERYRIIERLGAGAMGVVYAAQDVVLDREVAVKVLRNGLVAPDRSFKRFEREARALAAVVNPSVVGIHDRGQTLDGEPYLVMERVPGVSLQALVEDLSDSGAAPQDVSTSELSKAWNLDLHRDDSYVRTCVRWIAELADGAAAAHEAGIVHRDIKPSNVIIRDDGRATLLDFGIARFVEAEPLTDHDSSLGTPAFIAPECINDKEGASARSDVYGLAAVLYSLLALRPPFTGPPTKVLLDAATGVPAPIRSHHGGLATDLVAIVEKGMEREPGRRYASADALRADLLAFLDHRPVQARPIGPVRRQYRRLMRSRTGKTLVALAAVAMAGFAFATVDESIKSARATAWTSEWRQLPPNFAIVRPENRVVLGDADRTSLESGLDDLVAVASDPLPSRLLRASFRLDHGDLPGAAADMAAIAKREGSPLARALAESYANVAAGSSGSGALDLADLPDAEGPRDRYLRAWHHLRAFEDPQAEALLDDEVIAAVPYAEELRFALASFGRLDPVERRAKALRLESDVRLHEQRNVGRTATTAHFLAFARGHANDYPASLEAARESVALAPRSHVNRTNAAWSAFALGLLGESREHLEVALELRPNDFRPAQTLIWTWIAEGDFDAAHQARERVASALDGALPGWSSQFGLTIEAYRALSLWSTARDESRIPGSDPDLGAAVAAAERFREAARAQGLSNPSPLAQSMLEAVTVDDAEAVFAALVREHAGETRGLWSLSLVERHLPDTIGPDSTPLLRSLLSTLHEELSGASVLPR